MGSLIQNSNFVVFIVNGLIKWEIEKPSGQYLGLICDESLTMLKFEFKSGIAPWFYYTIMFMWRIAFTCLMVCNWQVRHGGQRQGSRQE
jgi:hypothetical protein